MELIHEAAITKFMKKYAASRNPLQRFVKLVHQANWLHFPAVKATFPAVDYTPASGNFVFDIGGNKYRLVARMDFQAQEMVILGVYTHEEYDRMEL